MQKTINLSTELPKLEAKGDYDGILKLLRHVQQQIPETERKDHQALHMNLARAYPEVVLLSTNDRGFDGKFRFFVEES